MTRGGASTAWSWRHAITRSGLSPTTRHLLITLSIFMDEAGGSCFPSVDQIVDATGLSKRAVLTHLDLACDAGWLRKQAHGYRGQKWRRQEYEALWPERDVAPRKEDAETDADSETEGGERGAPPPDPEAVNVVHEGGERRAPKVVNVVHQDKDQSRNHSNTSPAERERGREAGQRDDPAAEALPPPGEATRLGRVEQLEADWQALKAVWPDIALEAQEAARAKLVGLKAAERRAAIDAVPAFIGFHRERRGKARLPFLVNYLGERRWEDLPKTAAPPPGQAERAFIGAFDRAWWWLVFDWIARNAATIGDRDSRAHRGLLRMFSLATNRLGTPVAREDRERIEGAALGMAKAHLQGAEFKAWAAHAYTHFGITLPLPSATDWVWLPATDPTGWPWQDEEAA